MFHTEKYQFLFVYIYLCFIPATCVFLHMRRNKKQNTKYPWLFCFTDILFYSSFDAMLCVTNNHFYVIFVHMLQIYYSVCISLVYVDYFLIFRYLIIIHFISDVYRCVLHSCHCNECSIQTLRSHVLFWICDLYCDIKIIHVLCM